MFSFGNNEQWNELSRGLVHNKILLPTYANCLTFPERSVVGGGHQIVGCWIDVLDSLMIVVTTERSPGHDFQVICQESCKVHIEKEEEKCCGWMDGGEVAPKSEEEGIIIVVPFVSIFCQSPN
ncbi:hypothetical protein ACH5RR_010886 [Cinchona calisaya]|uniref:Uncharacterized protein n=1 Tax=Cinchona calisaya TaxID=153742 RepID=A0ABD3AK79_9GENT